MIQQMTRLQLASRHAIMKLLLNATVAADQFDEDQRTVLEKLILSGEGFSSWDDKMLRLLLEHGADVHRVLPHRDGWSMLHLCAKMQKPSAICLLMAYGADPWTQVQKTGLTPLHILASTSPLSDDHCTAAATLLRIPGKSRSRVARRRTPSSLWKSAKSKIFAARMLGGSSWGTAAPEEVEEDGVNLRDHQGCTALHHAVRAGNHMIVQLLLESSPIDILLKDNTGRRALELAEACLADSEQRLADETAKVNYRDPTSFVGTWSWKHVVLWMLSLDFGHYTNCYARAFGTAGVDGQDLIEMDELTLQTDFRFCLDVHSRKVMRLLNELCRDDEAAKEALETALKMTVERCLYLEFRGDEERVQRMLERLMT